MARILALDILKAAPQHAESLGASGISMLLAVTAHWDTLGSSVAVCWSNSRLGERTGLSRNSIPEVRDRLIKLGWLVYIQDGRNSGHYTPKLPEYHAQTSAVECANGTQFTVQTLCDEGAMTVQLSVQPLRSSLGSYIPMPIPEPIPEPIPNSFTLALAPESVSEVKTSKPRNFFGPEIQTNTGKPWQLPLTTAKRHMTAYGYSEESLEYQLKRFANHKAELPQDKRPGVGGMHRILESWLVKHAPVCAATELPIRAPRLSPDTLAACIEAQAYLDEQRRVEREIA